MWQAVASWLKCHFGFRSTAVVAGRDVCFNATLTLLASIAILWASSNPIPILVPLFVIAMGVPLGVWSLWLVLGLQRSAGGRLPRLRIVAWAMFPACAIIVAILLATRLPFQWRFAASRAAMEQHAQVMLNRPPEEGEAWGDCARFFSTWRLGAFTVGPIDVDYQRRHVYFSIGPGIRLTGLVYVGSSAEPPDDAWQRDYLPKGWWLFAQP
jgi:hypothetical protein